jgi:hypothetical protein
VIFEAGRIFRKDEIALVFLGEIAEAGNRPIYRHLITTIDSPFSLSPSQVSVGAHTRVSRSARKSRQHTPHVSERLHDTVLRGFGIDFIFQIYATLITHGTQLL